ncbi:MAG: CHAT domain-containing protein [Bacteroidota bacterium]
MLNLRSIIFWLLSIGCMSMGNSQSYKRVFDSIYHTVPATGLENVLDKHLKNLVKEADSVEMARMAHDFSVGLYKKRSYLLAIKYGLMEIETYESLKILNPDYAKSLYNIGLFYKKIDLPKKALPFFLKVVELDIDPVKTAQSYCKIGSSYFKLGDYFDAVTYYEKGIVKLEEQNQHKLLIGEYLDLSTVFDKIKTKESLAKMLYCLKRVVKHGEEFPLTKRQYFILNNGFANYYNNSKTFDLQKARYYYEQVVEKALDTGDSLMVGIAYSNLGNLYNKVSSDSSLYYLSQSLPYVTDTDKKAIIYHNICNYYLDRNRLEEAEWNIHEALRNNAYINEDESEVPSRLKLLNATDKYQVLSCLTTKATVLAKQFEQGQDVGKIKLALENLKAADTLVGIIQESSAGDGSKLFWRKEASEVYVKAMLCSQVLDEGELAFHYSEKNKALLLTESILENTERTELPITLVERSNYLKKEISRFENTLAEESMVDQNLIRDSLFHAKLTYRRFTDSLEASFPNYFASLSKTEIFSREEVREQMDGNSAIVSYVWNQEEERLDGIFGVVVTKDHTKVFKIPNFQSFQQLVSDYRILLQAPFETLEDKKRFQGVAHALYLRLFPSEEIRDLIQEKTLIIIPDNNLQNIPFEALVKDIHNPEYLIQSHEISYAYSMSFLLHNNGIVRKAEKKFIGYSPNQFAYDNLDSLTRTTSEVSRISDVMGGNTILNSNASKQHFLDEAPNYRILHLATHAEGGANPWIAFNDSKLKAHELYTFTNQADLVVLSACNTSLGKIAQGEGVLSLARGFFYSGANSVVSSLWNVNDGSTSDIMEEFYVALEEGETKSASLRRAKLNYLSAHSLSDASPYYWASFVLIGDAGSTGQISSYRSYIYITIGLLFLISLGLVYRRRKKKQILG